MKRKFTLLILAFTVLFLNVNAQFTTDGLYTIECVGTAYFMTAPDTLGASLPMSATSGENTQFYIVENTTNPGKYNIITTNDQFLAASDGTKGVLIANTEDNRNNNDSGALIDLINMGANPYYIESYPAGVNKRWNGQRDGNTVVGMGSNTTTKYQWNLTRIGNLPGGGDVAVTGVTLDQTTISISTGETAQLTATVNPADATNKTITWSSADAAIATVDQNGLVSAVAAGSTTITVTTTDGNFTANCTITVTQNNVAVTGVTLDKATVSLGTGETTQLTATVNPANAANKVVSWSSADAAIATVDQNGLVTAVAIGTTTITVTTADGGFTANCTATVTMAVQKSLSINFDDPNTLSNWILEGENVATASIVDFDLSRNASKALKVEGFSANTGFHFHNLSAGNIVASPGQYVHSIVYASTAIEGGQAASSFKSEWASVTPGFLNISTSEMTRLTFRRQYPDTETNNMDIFPRIRIKPGADLSNAIYFDDLVIYAHESDVTDIVSPQAATNLVIADQSASACTINWTEGMDTLTGVQMTYILRTVNTESNAPVLINQVAYGVNEMNQVGDWTIIAELEKGSATYTDQAINAGASYKYAIIHRDLAYNYSEALVSDIVSNQAVAVTGVSLDQTTIELEVGQTALLTETIAPANASNKAVTWNTANATVATVDQNGLITAVSEGTSTITVTTADGGFTATCTVTVTNTAVAVTGVALDQTSISIKTGETAQLAATVTPADAANKEVTWSSADAAIASVDQNGMITAVAAGTTTITVTTADGGFTATCTVDIAPAVIAATGVTLSQTTVSIANGETAQLTATVTPADAANKAVTWSSADAAIASVDQNGMITAVAVGTTTITVTTTDGGFTATCSVTVTPIMVTGVTLDKTSVSIITGETAQLTQTVSPANAANKDVTWSSADAAIASVDQNGMITAVAVGTTTITVTTADGSFTATCSVTVTPIAVTGVTLDQSSLEMKVGDTAQLTETVNPSNAADKTVTWSTADAAIASIDQTGTITAVAEGTTTITVTTNDGNFTAECTVVVSKKVGFDNILSGATFAVTLYPNPVSDFLNIKIDESNFTSATVKINDVSGRTIISSQLNKTNNQVDISALNKGMYIVEISHKQSIFTQKINKR